ncbi:MAG: GLPGLI family protein [Bacteroidales bacterium]|nr:GLPGLI family protein [Bacteroidales bacterium]
MEEGSEEILGYRCMKASTFYGGRHYTAYFTPEIPISDGPWKFHGLPGMILKVSDDEGDFTYEAISLENFHDSVIVSSLDGLTDSSPSQFEKASNAKREEVVTVFLYQGSEYQAGEYPYSLWGKE